MTTNIIPDVRAALGVARAALEGRNSAYGPADAIVGGLHDAGLLMSPGTAAELDRLRREHAALVESMTWHPQTCPAGQHRPWFADTAVSLPCPWCQLAELQATVRPDYVYRAERDGMPLGTYWTRAGARGHIEVLLTAEEGGTFRWAMDAEPEPDDGEEALLVPYDGPDIQTGYFVVAVPVDAAYDPEAEG